jgi:5'-3' exonuclease
MDCNSIIYDEFNTLDLSEYTNVSNMESALINNVIKKISSYITYINPSHSVFIAFDGVVPLAKMEQQRTRRYKGSINYNIINDVSKTTNTKDNISWSTSNITPGTEFMKKLTKQIKKAFKGLDKHFNVGKIIVSGTDEFGEGEHKMFKYIRNSKITSSDTIAVYGLDSDLIMLSIFHCTRVHNIFIFREKPEFAKQITTELCDDEFLFMDILTFSHAILSEMNCYMYDYHRLYDYIFMCFLLGNDFLPHFPSLNIRTSGIDTLLTTYRNVIGKHNNRHFISVDMIIEWKCVSIFMNELAKYEHTRLLNEFVLREKWAKKKWFVNTDDSRDFTIKSVPVIYRAEELYICPKERLWENRYYKSLFKPEYDIESVCINYLEGLEWVFKYYTDDCPHWKWRYNYHYPPLLNDLVRYIPNCRRDLIKHDNSPFSEFVQLAYVLPPSNHSLLSPIIKNDLDTLYPDSYVSKFEFKWAFCRYFWEAHAILPDVSIDTLNEWNTRWNYSKRIKKN